MKGMGFPGNPAKKVARWEAGKLREQERKLWYSLSDFVQGHYLHLMPFSASMLSIRNWIFQKKYLEYFGQPQTARR